MSDRTPLLRGDAPASSAAVFVATAFSTIGPLLFGFGMGYTSPTLAQLAKDLHLTSDIASIFTAIINVGAMIGALSSGFLLDRFGRRASIQISCIPYLLGWLFTFATYYAHSLVLLFMGRILIGIAIGLTSSATPTYISEIAPMHLRGTLGATFQLSITVGILLVYGLGDPMPWQWLAFVGAVPSAILFFVCFFLPQSPRWLVSRGRRDDAENALRRLRGPGADISAELAELDAVVARKEPPASIRLLLDRSLVMPLVISLGLMVYQQMSGINAVISNSTSIFKAAGITNADATSLGLAGAQVIATVVAVLLMDRAGRRALLLISSSGMAITICVLGVYFYLATHQKADNLGPLAIVAAIGYILMFSLGTGAIPWLITGEIFPTRVRGIAASLATVVNWSMSFLVTETFQYMQDSMQQFGVFWFYAGVCACGFFFVFLLVPETKGKSQEEIAESFRPRGYHPIN